MIDPVAAGHTTGRVDQNHFGRAPVRFRQETLGTAGLIEPPEPSRPILLSERDFNAAPGSLVWDQ